MLKSQNILASRIVLEFCWNSEFSLEFLNNSDLRTQMALEFFNIFNAILLIQSGKIKTFQTLPSISFSTVKFPFSEGLAFRTFNQSHCSTTKMCIMIGVPESQKKLNGLGLKLNYFKKVLFSSSIYLSETF